MLIVDGQVHIWHANTPQRPWPVRSPPHMPHKGLAAFSKDELLREMDAAGAHRALLVPPPWEGKRNDIALEAARQHPDRFAVVGVLDIDAPSARAQIASWCLQPGMLGLRLNLKTQGVPTDHWLWPEAEAARVPIMMAMSEGELHDMGRVAERYPDLKLLIVHLAIVFGRKDDAAFAHLDKLLALARYPNVAVQVSSLPAFTTDSYPYHRLHPYIRRVYDAFGPQRMFWGTHLTVIPCSYLQAITMFTEEIPWLTAEDKEWIMGRGLCEWSGWGLPQARHASERKQTN